MDANCYLLIFFYFLLVQSSPDCLNLIISASKTTLLSVRVCRTKTPVIMSLTYLYDTRLEMIPLFYYQGISNMTHVPVVPLQYVVYFCTMGT